VVLARPAVRLAGIASYLPALGNRTVPSTRRLELEVEVNSRGRGKEV
jgi:hypothetical protein